MTPLQSISTFVIAGGMFACLTSLYYLGHNIRKRNVRNSPEQGSIDLKPINGMLLGLLGLLLAFTFSMSNSRYTNRRDLIVEEANAIGTTVLRVDVYPDSMRNILRTKLKHYVELRVAFYQAGMDWQKTFSLYQQAEQIANETWSIAARYARIDPVTTRTSQLLPSLNEMIDVAASRRAAGEGTIPDAIMYFLFVLCFVSAFLLGYDHQQRIDWIVVVGFALMLSTTVFCIIDLDRPRSGLINLDAPNQKIADLLKMFGDDKM